MCANSPWADLEQVRGDRLPISVFRNRIVRPAMSMQQLAGAVAGPARYQVVDHTGIAGVFDIDLKWAAEGSDDTGPSLFNRNPRAARTKAGT